MSDEVIRRDPTEEGDFMCGTWTWAADQLALVCMHNSPKMCEDTNRLFERLDQHLTALALKGGLDTQTARTEGLGFLLREGEILFDDARKEFNRNMAPEDLITPTPNETRDWFCWLYRHFREWKREQELNARP